MYFYIEKLSIEDADDSIGDVDDNDEYNENYLEGKLNRKQ